MGKEGKEPFVGDLVVGNFHDTSRTVLYRGYIGVEYDSQLEREVIVASDSIAVFIYDLKSNKVVLVKQARAPMKGKTDGEGMIVESPAGRFDKKIGIKELAVLEVKEETGIDITIDKVEIINFGVPVALSPGILTEVMYLAAVEMDLSEVHTDSRIYGVAEEGERIIRLILSPDELITMVHRDMKTLVLAQFLQIKILLQMLNAK
jgi:8-oxo-dGTP pyrophosphatase MutT (NUDIX family)